MHYRPSITHSLLTYSFTYLHSHTHTEPIRECWYALKRALNTRLDVSETHLSPCSCVETMLSASEDVCMYVGVNVICQVWGQSNSPSNDWFIIWLTGRLPPLLCLLLSCSSFIIHCLLLIIHPSSCIHSSVAFNTSHLDYWKSFRHFITSCLSSPPLCCSSSSLHPVSLLMI